MPSQPPSPEPVNAAPADGGRTPLDPEEPRNSETSRNSETPRAPQPSPAPATPSEDPFRVGDVAATIMDALTLGEIALLLTLCAPARGARRIELGRTRRAPAAPVEILFQALGLTGVVAPAGFGRDGRAYGLSRPTRLGEAAVMLARARPRPSLRSEATAPELAAGRRAADLVACGLARGGDEDGATWARARLAVLRGLFRATGDPSAFAA